MKYNKYINDDYVIDNFCFRCTIENDISPTRLYPRMIELYESNSDKILLHKDATLCEKLNNEINNIL